MKKILFSILFIAVVGGAAWYFFAHRKPAPVAGEEKSTAQVETTPLSEGSFAQTIEVFGVVAAAPSGERVVSAPYDVVVRQIHVAVGSTLKAGELLLEIDPGPEVRLAADSAHSARVLGEKALASIRERFDLRLATRPELEAAEQAADDARLKDESFVTRGIRGDGRIVAATDGVVSKLDLVAGALVAAGAPLVTVSTGTVREVRFGVETADLARVAAGQSVTIESVTRQLEGEIPGTIRVVGATIDPASGTAEVRAILAGDTPLLLGEKVRGQIVVTKHEHAWVVPRSAVLRVDDKLTLFTVRDGKAVRHEVKLGLTSRENIEVMGEGIATGDMIVTVGNYELEDGMAVEDRKELSKPSGITTEKPAKEIDP